MPIHKNIRRLIVTKQTICVLFGGASSEHKISCISAGNVISQLDRELFDVICVGIDKEGNWFLTDATVDEIRSGQWEKGHNKSCMLSPVPKHHGLLVFNKNGDVSVTHVDVVHPVLHGKNGEDGTVQGLLELAGIPYVGSGVLGSSLCMDKVLAKEIFAKSGIPVAEGFFLWRGQYDVGEVHNKIENSFGYPVVVKPSRAGSSVGVVLVHKAEDLAQGLAVAAAEDDKILVERFVDAREVECAVLGKTQSPEASCVGEIVAEGVYDYDTKYVNDNARLDIPAKLSAEEEKTIRELACKAYTASDCSGLARVDFFIDKNSGQVILNEINTLPGFTDISMYPKLWEASGVPCKELLTRLIKLAQ